MSSKFYNYQYYQSGEYVVVSFLGLRGIPEENILVNIQPTNLTVTINHTDSDPFTKSLDLFLPIDPATSTYKVFASKVEIKLHKVEQVNWPTLETASVQVLPTPSSTPTTTASSFSTQRWDRFCEENKEEVDTSGEKLFRVLYEGATQEQRRAMIKSLQQSNGKVLNMNWDEVKDKNFEEEAKK